ncbi:hypothetical protein [Streptomyces sp. NPDC059176]|uniref:hypothetical protein n=1 Tax=Streptomyces sp. NPDC059176 TaxID=3346758 RepID=UPI0036A04122
MEPSKHGHVLAPGDELGLDVTPDCCGDEMTPNGRTFTCSTCWTVLTVDSHGLVADIT